MDGAATEKVHRASSLWMRGMTSSRALDATTNCVELDVKHYYTRLTGVTAYLVAAENMPQIFARCLVTN